jgi:hypothetical protein
MSLSSGLRRAAKLSSWNDGHAKASAAAVVPATSPALSLSSERSGP